MHTMVWEPSIVGFNFPDNFGDFLVKAFNIHIIISNCSQILHFYHSLPFAFNTCQAPPLPALL
jgi:hypothetical protein